MNQNQKIVVGCGLAAFLYTAAYYFNLLPKSVAWTMWDLSFDTTLRMAIWWFIILVLTTGCYFLTADRKEPPTSA